MASINHPIAGDLSYGSTLLGADFPSNSQGLELIFWPLVRSPEKQENSDQKRHSMPQPSKSERNHPRRCSHDFYCDRLFLHCSRVRMWDLNFQIFEAHAPLPSELGQVLDALDRENEQVTHFLKFHVAHFYAEMFSHLCSACVGKTFRFYACSSISIYLFPVTAFS